MNYENIMEAYLVLKEDIDYQLSKAKARLQGLERAPKTKVTLKRIEIAKKAVAYLEKQKGIIDAAVKRKADLAKRAKYIKMGKIGAGVAVGAAGLTAAGLALKRRQAAKKAKSESFEYKNMLHDLITEKYLNNEIDKNKFYRMSDNIEKISESKAEEIFNEQVELLIAAGIGLVWGASAGFLINRYIKAIVTGQKKCKLEYEKIQDPVIRKQKIIECRINFMKKAINELKSERPKCKQVKNPEKCYKQIDKALEFFEKNIRKLKE